MLTLCAADLLQVPGAKYGASRIRERDGGKDLEHESRQRLGRTRGHSVMVSWTLQKMVRRREAGL